MSKMNQLEKLEAFMKYQETQYQINQLEKHDQKMKIQAKNRN